MSTKTCKIIVKFKIKNMEKWLYIKEKINIKNVIII